MGLFPTITSLTFFFCAMKLDKTFDKTVRAGVRNYVPNTQFDVLFTIMQRCTGAEEHIASLLHEKGEMQVLCTIMYAQPRTPRGIRIHYDGSMGMRGAKCALGHK